MEVDISRKNNRVILNLDCAGNEEEYADLKDWINGIVFRKHDNWLIEWDKDFGSFYEDLAGE